MTSRLHLQIIICFALLLFFGTVATAQQPRLAEEEVAAIADAKVREEGYFPDQYHHGAPMYVRTSGVWEMRYYVQEDRKFTIAVDDVSRFASLSPATSVPAMSATPAVHSAFAGVSWIRAIAIGLGVGLVFRLTAWLRRKTSDTRASAKA